VAGLNSNLVKYSALYGAYVVALHAIDGPWQHWKEGWEGRAVDPWTSQHLLWGLIGQRMGLNQNEILVLTTINEAVELGVRTFRPDLLWGSPESPRNVIVDIVATWAGWKLGELARGLPESR
jgi:hypothetical protein